MNKIFLIEDYDEALKIWRRKRVFIKFLGKKFVICALENRRF